MDHADNAPDVLRMKLKTHVKMYIAQPLFLVLTAVHLTLAQQVAVLESALTATQTRVKVLRA